MAQITFILQVMKLQFGVGQWIIPGDYCGFLWCCQPSTQEDAMLVQPGQWHALKNTLVKQAFHLRPGRNLCQIQ